MDVREKSSEEKRLIDADRAMEIVRNQGIAHPNAYHLTNYATLILREAPTVDVVEVVRCLECKHYDPENYHCDHPIGTAAPLKRKPDDFCFGKHYPEPAWCEIKTLEGTMIANAGDYIIQGVH